MEDQSLKARTIKGVLWSASERFGSQGIHFILGIIIARLLLPSDYGLIGMLSVFMAVSQTFIDSGFYKALVRKKELSDVDFSTAFYFNIVIGVLCYGLLFVSAPYISSFYHEPRLTILTRVIGLNLIFNSFCVVQRAYFTIRIDFKTQTKITFIASFCSGIAALFLAYKGWGFWALAIQSVLLNLLTALLFWLYSRWRPLWCFSKKSFVDMFSFGSKLLASGLLETIYQNLYTIVIGKMFSATDLGYYTRAYGFAILPSENISTVLSRVFYPVLSKMQDDDEWLYYNYRRLLRLSVYIVFPIMIAMAALSTPMISFLLTDKWLEVAPLLKLLSFAMMLYPVSLINLNIIMVKGRSDLTLRLEVVKKILGIGVLCITVQYSVFVMCCGLVFTWYIGLFVNTYYTEKLIGLSIWSQLKDIYPIFLLSIFSGVVVYLLLPYFSVVWVQLLLGCIIYFFIYATGSYMLGLPELKEILNIIKK